MIFHSLCSTSGGDSEHKVYCSRKSSCVQISPEAEYVHEALILLRKLPLLIFALCVIT